MSYEAEQNIIGSLLINPGCINEVVNILTPEMFEDEILRNAYMVFQAGYRDRRDVDMAVLQEELQSDRIPDAVIKEALLDAFNNTATSVTVKSYARTLSDAHRAKRLIEVLGSIRGRPADINEDIERVIAGVSALREIDRDTQRTVSEIVSEYKDSYFKESSSPKIMTGMSSLDEILGGFDGGDLILIGARPAVGKSAFAAQLALHFATTCGLKVGYFNLEMQNKQIYERFVAAKSGIELRRIRMATKFLPGEQERFDEANEYLMTVKDIVISTGSKRIDDIRTECAGKDFGIVIVDYLQLVKGNGLYRGNRYAEVGQISHEAKALAMDLNIPVIALCQLNRAVVGRADREPTMSDIRESGDFEQDASTILLLWNTDENNPTKKCIKVEKQRQGRIGRVDLEFDGNRMTFKELGKRSREWSKAETPDDIPFDF